ncbi:DUF2726 domain-containing protein [Micromonospora chokoriensis]
MTSDRGFVRPLLSPSERAVEAHLSEMASGRGWRIYAGVKLSAVVDPKPPGVTDRDWYDTATRQHLDFVVTNEQHLPQFVVELDDPTHRRPDAIRRDRIKDAVLEGAGLEILRIESQHVNKLADGRSLVEYLIDARGHTAKYVDMQSKGLAPRDEWPDYRLLISLHSRGRISLDNDLAMTARMASFHAHKAGKVADMYPQCGNFYWRNGWAEGWTWQKVVKDRYLFASVRLRTYRFRCSMGPGELAEDLAVAAIGRHLERYLAGEGFLLPTSELTRKFNRLAKARSEIETEVTDFPFGERTTRNHHCHWPPSCVVLHPSQPEGLPTSNQ